MRKVGVAILGLAVGLGSTAGCSRRDGHGGRHDRTGGPAAAPAGTAPGARAGAPAEARPPAASFAAPADRCAVTVETSARSKLGARGVAHLSMRGANGFHVNKDAPLVVTASSSDLELPQTRFETAQAHLVGTDEVQLDVPFTGRARGRKSMSLHARFGVCSTGTCAECSQRRELTTLVD